MTIIGINSCACGYQSPIPMRSIRPADHKPRHRGQFGEMKRGNRFDQCANILVSFPKHMFKILQDKCGASLRKTSVDVSNAL